MGLWYLLDTFEASMSAYHQYILQEIAENHFFHAYLLVHEQESVLVQEIQALQQKLREKYQVFDHYILEAEKGSIDVEATREFRQKFTLQTVGKVKVGYISSIEKMTLPAQQMLLKLLEEAPKNTLFILTTTRIKRLSAPILSRVRTVRLQNKGSIEIKPVYEKWFENLFAENISLFEKQKIIEEIEKTENTADVDFQLSCYIWQQKNDIDTIQKWLDSLSFMHRNAKLRTILEYFFLT